MLGEFIARHLEAALAEEKMPAVRCALLYRLTVAYSRRLGRLNEAERWAEVAIAEAEAIEVTDRKYQTSWALNILAYVRTRQKDALAARDCMVGASGHVSVAGWVAEPLSAESGVDGDFALTRSLVVHNLAVAEAATGDLQGYSERLQSACLLEAKIERSAKYWAQSLVPHCKQILRLDLALDAANEGLLAATRDNNVSFRLFFILQVADLEYRLGQARVASESYLSAQSLVAKLSPLEAYPDLDLPLVSALEAAGDLDRAEEILLSKLSAGNNAAPDVAAETVSRLAVLAARRGDSTGAEKWASQATERVAAEGVRHRLVRTGLQLGRAARFLERPEEAADLLLWALDLIDNRTDSASVSPIDELMVLTELGRSSALSPTQAQRSLSLLAENLSASASAWWCLPDAFEHWLSCCGDQELGSGSFAAKLKTLLSAAEQRSDCRSLVQRMQAGLEHVSAPISLLGAEAVPQYRA